MTNIIKKVALFFKGNSYSTPKINNDLFSHVDTSSKITLKSLEKLSKTNSNNISRLNEYCNRLSEMVSEIYKENQELKEENQKLSKKIDELNGKFHGMANWFALPQSVSQEEKEKFNISIESLLEDYKTLTLKNFKEKYSNYKVIGLENADLIRVNRNLQPNFSEIATGKYLAIELENSIYSVYLQKNLNLYDDIFDGIGVTFIFEFDIEPLKGFTYGDWKLVKPAVFQHMTNNRWLCMEKGKIFLDPENLKEKEVLVDKPIVEAISKPKEKIKKTDPYNLNKAKRWKPSYNQPSYENEIVTYQNKFYVYCKTHYENKNRDFLSLFAEVFTLDLINDSDVAYSNSDNVSLIFDESERGVYNAIKIPEIDNNNYFVFYKRNNISYEDKAMRKVFNFDKEPEPQKLYSNWKITKPAKFSNNGGNNWNLLEKGDITLDFENFKKKEVLLNKPIVELISKHKEIEIPNFILVNGGTFKMGDTLRDGLNFEKPVHNVTLTYNFYMGKYEVTQKEYKSLMKTNPSYFKGNNLPVEQVTWFDAIKYCNELSKKEGLLIAYDESTGDLLDSNGSVTTDITKVKGYRLPTEAEWEYSARGGDKSQGYEYSGSSNVDKVAWYGSNSGSKTHAVGSKQANELGLYDMSGNVWEWCTDWDDYTSFLTNPYIHEKGSNRVYRGGSWFFDASDVRVFGCNFNTPSNKPSYSSYGLGFRVVRTK